MSMRLSKSYFTALIVLSGSAGVAAEEHSAAQIPEFRLVDLDRNGFISDIEALKVPRLLEHFTQLDRDMDGRLSAQEYQAYLLVIAPGRAGKLSPTDGAREEGS